MHKYYIDESGHSGDLATSTGADFDFEGQPYFTLAAVGVVDLPKLESAVGLLRSRHRIPAGELKSKSLQAKPAFVAGLLNLLVDEKCQLFVEVVDKRYFVCTHIVNIVLLRAEPNFGSAIATWRWQNSAADWLYDCVTEHVLNRFVEACKNPSDETVKSALGSLLKLTFAHGEGEDLAFNQLMRELVEDTIRAYGRMRECIPTAYLSFLPPPDESKHARKIWLLPNFSSLTNLYARINKYHGKRIKDVTLVHDQQLQLDRILEGAKFSAEAVGDAVFTPYSDYYFTESCALEFSSSDKCVGIQCADVLAGTVMRYFRDRARNQSIPPEIELVMRTLLGGIDSVHGYQVNQVVSSRLVLQGLP